MIPLRQAAQHQSNMSKTWHLFAGRPSCLQILQVKNQVGQIVFIKHKHL